MTTADALLADIVAHPEDDAPRLVYADWLDDHGEPDRAEFIRLQIELARVSPGEMPPAALARREAELLRRHEEEWRAALPALKGVTWREFVRGFVDRVEVHGLRAFQSRGAALLAAAPVRSVKLRLCDDDPLHELAACPHLARLAELDLGGQALEPHDAAALAASPHLGGLRSLLLHGNFLGTDGVGAIAGTASLGGLRELYLSGNYLTDPAVLTLAASPHLANLEVLDLRDNLVGDPGAAALAGSDGLARLVTLWLVNNRIGPMGAAALACSTRLPRLAWLYLNHNPVGDEGARVLALSPHRAGLRELDLRSAGLTDPGGRALAESPHLAGLAALWLGGNRFGRAVAEELRRRFGERLRL